MRGPELLKSYEDNWETEIGACFPGERIVVRGLDLFSNFKDTGWMEYLLFAVTGRRDKKLAAILETVWVYCTSFPDPRIWNNRVAALVGTSRGTAVLGVSAGIAVSEATVYGMKPIKGASDFFLRLKKLLGEGFLLENLLEKEIQTYRSIYGYGRPMTKTDERIPPMIEAIKDHGLIGGEYLKMAFDVEGVLEKKYKMRMNIAAVYAALMCDQKLTAMEAYYMTTLSFSAGIFASYVGALEKPEGAFFPLNVDRINSEETKKQRVWGVTK